MRCTSVLILFASLVALVAAQNTTVTGTLGQSTSVNANTATTINYGVAGTAAQLVITTDANCQVTLSLLVNTAFTLDSSLSQYSIGSLASAAASIGYRLAVSNGAKITSATITSEALALSFLTQLTGNVGGILYYDATTKGYLELPAQLVQANSKAQFSAPLAGDYVFVFRASTQPAAALFNRAVAIAANTQSSIQLHSSTTTRLVVTQTTSADSSFTATESASAPAGSNTNGLVRISSFFDLQSSANAGISSNLQYTYTAADEAKADATQLAWYYYNTASGAWDLDGSSSVDVNARVVSHASTHFSTWMVAAKSLSAAALPALLLVAFALAAVTLA